MNVIKLIFILLSVFSVGYFHSQMFTFQIFNHKQGLNLTDVNIVRQDINGYLWVGTSGAGVQKFDGYNFEKPNELSSNEEHFVSFLHPDKNKIYVASRFSGFYEFYKNRYKRLNFPIEYLGEFTAIYPFDNKFLLCGSLGLCVSDSKKVYSKIKIDTYTEAPIQIVEKNSYLFVFYQNQSFVVANNKIQKINSWLGLSDKVKLSFCSLNNDNTIHFYDLKNNTKYSISSKQNHFNNKIISSTFIHPKMNKVKTVFTKNNQLLLVDSTNQIFYLKDQKLKQITINFKNKDFEINSAFIDNNNDFWACTNNMGLLKISLEAISKNQLNHSFLNPLISFIHKNKDDQFILSDFNGKTFVGYENSNSFATFTLRIYGYCDYLDKTLYATNQGVLYFENGFFKTFNNIKDKIIFIFSADNRLFYCIEGKGLSEFFNNTSKNIISKNSASHIYTAQFNENLNSIYFGTNVGLFAYNLNKKSIFPLHKKHFYPRGYSGVSIKDKYGNFWFSSGKSLIFISKNENIKYYSELKSLTSNLYYTLNSDTYSNLWLGTNNGINKININKSGSIINVTQYTKENGFDGYETHMRSSFQENGLIYIGTIEGLYIINSKIFESSNTPPPPIITYNVLKKAKNSFESNDLVYIKFVSVNSKFKNVKYTYRIKGKIDNWSKLSKENIVYFTNLNEKDYVFEVKATYNGINYSKISNYKIENNIPFWKSNWFIIIVVLIVAVLNLLFLERNKSFSLFKGINEYSEDLSDLTKISFIVFGWISTSLMNYFSVYIDNKLTTNLFFDALLSLILLIIIIISIYQKPSNIFKKNNLKIGLYSVMIHSYLGIYISNIHPYYLVIICICFAVVPLVINSINELIIFCSIQIVISCSYVILFENTIYDDILFLVAIIVSVCISIFSVIFRKESINKLLFVSFLVNKGKFFALSFDNHYKIKFLSESLVKLLGKDSVDLFDTNLTELNKYIARNNKIDNKIDNKFDRTILKTKRIIAPIKTKLNKQLWIDWTLHKLNKTQYVLLGQNISNQKNIESENDFLYESTNEMIFEFDLHGDLLKSNSLFKETFNLNENSNIKNIFSIVFPEEMKSIQKYYQNLFIQKQNSSSRDIYCLNKDGKRILISLNLTFIYDSENPKFIKKIFCKAKDLTKGLQMLNKIHSLEDSFSEIKHSIFDLNHFDDDKREDLVNQFSKYKKIYFSNSEVISDFDFIEKINDNIILITGSFINAPSISNFMVFFIKSSIKYLIYNQKITEPKMLLSIIEENYKIRFNDEFIKRNNLQLEIQIIRYNTTDKSLFYSTAGGQFINCRSGDIILQKGESKLLFDTPSSNFSQYNTYEIQSHRSEYLILFTSGLFNINNYNPGQNINLINILNFFKENKSLPLDEQIIILESFIEKNIKFDRYRNNFGIIALKF